MDPRSGEFFDPAKATFIASLGLKHFFDAFALEHKRDVRVDAARAFFLLDAAWVRSRAERPSVSYTKVMAKSQGQAKSCKYTTKTQTN